MTTRTFDSEVQNYTQFHRFIISGILLYELHAPIMMLLNHKRETRQLSKKQLKHSLQRILTCLRESYDILQFESENTMEGKIGRAAKEALQSAYLWEKQLGNFSWKLGSSPTCRTSWTYAQLDLTLDLQKSSLIQILQVGTAYQKEIFHLTHFKWSVKISTAAMDLWTNLNIFSSCFNNKWNLIKLFCFYSFCLTFH